MALKVGQEIQIKINASYLSGETDTSFSMAADMLDKTSKSSCNSAKEFAAGETGGTMSASGLYDPAQVMGFNDILALLQLRAAVTIYWGEATANVDLFYTSGFISGVSCNGPKNDIANYTVDIQLTGVINETTI